MKPVEPRSPIQLGKNVFIRTVTHYYLGKIVHVSEEEIVLKDCSWIADTGRFSEAMKNGTANEVEPYPDGVLVSVNRGAIVDVSSWSSALLRVVK